MNTQMLIVGGTFDHGGGTEVHSYRAHLRWVPIDGIELNRAITDRYSNLIPTIKAIANKF